ncbi:MAG: ANTAR domain-containing protein [Lachnospiraceae bacterium]|nr:ANTAR domain-containing protein [Lachnospiraceae bacterium]
MAEKEVLLHSLLIVSGSEAFDAVVRKALPPGNYMSVNVQRNAAAARRSILERFYDLIVINAPVGDAAEPTFALDLAEMCQAAIVMAVPQEAYEEVREQVVDAGILVIAKPFTVNQMRGVLRLAIAWERKLHELRQKVQKAQEKYEDERIINRAKFLLMEKRGLTEKEAHRQIGAQAMNHGTSRRRIAEWILEEEED